MHLSFGVRSVFENVLFCVVVACYLTFSRFLEMAVFDDFVLVSKVLDKEDELAKLLKCVFLFRLKTHLWVLIISA